MKLFKKNQVVVIVIGLMLITAGYLNFTNHPNDTNTELATGVLADSEKMAAIGDAQLVSSTPIETNTVQNQIENTETAELVEENIEEEPQNMTEEVEVNAEEASSEYFTQSRLDRDNMYSQMLESYQKILDKTNISETQKNTAQKEIQKINQQKNAIMITENLIKTKGFEDLVIFINGDSVNVIIKASKLEKDEIAQIQNIITRELSAKIENIHISNKE